MKTNCSWVSKRLGRMAELYLPALARAIPACAIPLALLAGLCGPTGASAGAQDRSFCVLVPHFKDEYWLSVAYGIEQASKRHHVTPRFFEAGGYRAREQQIRQLEACAHPGVDAVLIGAVTSDHPDLLAAIERTARAVPVVALVNELHSDALAARIGVDWRDMGLELGRFLAARHPAGTAPQRAVLLSGPAESGWIGPLEGGLRAGLADAAVEIEEVFRADTGQGEQLDALERALAAYPDPDYVIGPAPAIEAAMGLLRAPGARSAPTLVATYVSHSVRRGLIGGQVLAAPDDDPEGQGEMAIDVVQEIAAGAAAKGAVGPQIRIITRDTAAEEIRLSPADYFPSIE